MKFVGEESRALQARHDRQLPQEDGQATNPCEMGGCEQATVNDPLCGHA